MSKRPRGNSRDCSERTNRNDPRISFPDMGRWGTRVVQSPVAVHTLRWHRRVARIPIAEEPGADTVLAVGGSIGQVPDSVLAVGRPGKPSALAQPCAGTEDHRLRRNRTDEPAILDGDGPQRTDGHSRCAADSFPRSNSYPPVGAHDGLADWLHGDHELLVCAVAAHLQIG